MRDHKVEESGEIQRIPMPNENFSFEAIDAYITKINIDNLKAEKATVSGLKSLVPGEKAVGKAALPGKFCDIYAVVRPIIIAIKLFPVPKKWKDLIDIFIELMDKLCPKARESFK